MRGAADIQFHPCQEFLEQLATPAVRDLAWACFSPQLLDSRSVDGEPGLHYCDFPLDTPRRHWLAALDADPQPLLDWLEDSRKGRIGLYFERLWHFFLQCDPAVELVAHNLPVRSGGLTLGEFDVIYFCRRRQCHAHLELAVKFYLRRAGANNDWRNWLGPNSRDRLDRKIGRMRDHQLHLADTDAGRAVLAGLGVHHVEREIALKGRLYRHRGEPGPAPGAAGATGESPLPDDWLYLRELPGTLPADMHYALLDRQQWLAPVMARDARCVAARELDSAVQSAMATYMRPLQIARLETDGREAQRTFVVPDNWPQLQP
ncbi:DUF1853 family protein [Haliea sp. E17]|uniref:DUF1853 family protein n=1 Tax=Haliea sp. E17 TaxID=3401576 RepID=UPI003AAB3FE4